MVIPVLTPPKPGISRSLLELYHVYGKRQYSVFMFVISNGTSSGCITSYLSTSRFGNLYNLFNGKKLLRDLYSLVLTI